MIEAFKLVGQIALEGAEKVKTGLENVEKRAKGVSDKFKNAGKKTTDFGKKMSVGLTTPIVALGAGLIGISKQTGDYADRILDLNAITGMSTSSIQEWQHVAKIAGVSSEFMTDASQQLTRTMTNLANGTGKGSDALETLGINFEDLDKASPDERMELLTKALQGIEDPAERARLGTDLFRGAYEDLAPVLTLSEEQLEGAKKEANELGSVLGDDALNDANNFRIEMEQLTTRIGNMGRELAMDVLPILKDIFLPIIESGIEKVRALSNWFMGLSDSQKEMIAKTLLIVATIGPLLMVFGTMITMVGSAISSFGLIFGAISKVIKVVKLMNLAFLMGPWGLVIAGVVAVIAIGILLYKNWDKIKAFLLKSWEVIKRVAIDTWNKVTGAVMNAKEKATSTIENMRRSIQSKIDALKNKVKTTFQNIATAIWKPVDSAKNKVSNFVQKIKGFFTNLRLKIPKIQIPSLPTFRVHNWSWNPKDWISNPPRLGVSWNAQGGYVNGATLIGAGEAGGEGIVPLEGKHMLPIAQQIAKFIGAMGGDKGQSLTVEAPVYLNGREIARAITPNINTELERQRQIKKRGV